MEKQWTHTLKSWGAVAHAPSKDGDDAMASICMLDSLGPLMEKNNAECEKRAVEYWNKKNPGMY